MSLSLLNALHFDGGANLTSDNDTDDSVRQLFNKLIELAQSWKDVLATAFTTAGAGAWEDVTGMTEAVALVSDSFEINARADLEFESPGTAAATLAARIIIGTDSGEEFIVDVPNADTDSRVMSVTHSFTGVKGTSYTVKLQVQDDATTTMTVNKATMDVSLGATLV
jgi:hypothetical protein